MLKHDEDMEIVGEVENGRQANHEARKFKPEVVLMDVYVPQVDWIQATSVVTVEFDKLGVMLLAPRNDNVQMLRAIRACAIG